MLPDLRNLGTILRVLLAVNGAALVVAFAREQRWTRLFGGVDRAHELSSSRICWPSSSVLALIAPWLSRQRYVVGAGIVLRRHGRASASLMFAMLDRMMPGSAGSLARQLDVRARGRAGAAVLFPLARAARLSPAITEARLQALQARIRPHFLFNSINAVLSLVRSDPQRAEAALEDMADLFRVLMRDNRELTPLEDEVALCRQYLDLEKLRLGDRLIVDWNVKSMPADALVPPLVLQPLLENAVYHGIEPSSEPGTVSINLFLSRGEVHAILQQSRARQRSPPLVGQQDGARQRARAPRAAFRCRGEPRIARHRRTATKCISGCPIAPKRPEPPRRARDAAPRHAAQSTQQRASRAHVVRPRATLAYR